MISGDDLRLPYIHTGVPEISSSPDGARERQTGRPQDTETLFALPRPAMDNRMTHMLPTGPASLQCIAWPRNTGRLLTINAKPTTVEGYGQKCVQTVAKCKSVQAQKITLQLF